ncbi:MAG: hypothetical protein GC162_14885 [Planctomycetes bacterium]|nr:hypothetical protein [Planctomycetota bacterium]
MDVGKSLYIGARGTVNILGGTLRLTGDTPFVLRVGGQLEFNTGTIAYDGDLNFGSLAYGKLLTLFPTRTIPTYQGFEVAGAFTLGEVITVDGGTLSFGSLLNAGYLDFQKGTINVLSADVNIGSSGLFGPSVVLDATKTINVSNNVTLNSIGTVDLKGGIFSGGVIDNQGLILLESPLGGLAGGTLSNSGLVTGSGRIDNALANQASGQVRVLAGQDLRFTGSAPHDNAGLIESVAGVMEFTDHLTNEAVGRITGRDALYVFTGGLNDLGQLNFTGGTNDVYGDVDVAGGGRITTSGPTGTTSNFFGNVHHNGQRIQTAAGNMSVFFGDVTGAGAFTGTGTVRFEGTYSPGNSPAVVSFGGDMQMGDASELKMDLAGSPNKPGLSPTSDELIITDDVALDGKLKLNLAPDFAPIAGQIFPLLAFGGDRTGRFDDIDGQGLLGQVALLVLYDDDPGGIDNEVIARATMLGDADVSGRVDISDLVILAKNFGAAGQMDWFDGDFNFDGKVDISDLVLLGKYFDLSDPAATPIVTALRAVPEPGMCVFWMGMFAGMGGFLGKKRGS